MREILVYLSGNVYVKLIEFKLDFLIENQEQLGIVKVIYVRQ